MTVIVPVVVFVVLTMFVAPWVDSRRDRDASYARRHRVNVDPRPPAPPRFTRDDPSPRRRERAR